MDVDTPSSTLSAMTPAQQGVFFELLRKQAPAWLLQSSPDIRDQLYKSLLASYRTRRTALDELQTLQSPQAFCAPLLAKAMSDKLGEPLDVTGVVFQHVRSTSSLLGLRKKLVLPIDRDLLTAACENFEASETAASNYHEQSLVYVPARITGNTNKILSIAPHEFAQLCRTLDLGKLYQGHVRALLGDDTHVGSLRDKYLALLKDQFDVDRHIAYMKKHISAQVYGVLQSVRDALPGIKLGDQVVGYQGLEMFNIKLNGPMYIGPVGEAAAGGQRCVIYLPDDPVNPLREYAAFRDFEVDLNSRLQSAGYREFFMRFVALKDRSSFIKGWDARQLIDQTTLFPSIDSLPISRFKLKDELFLAIYHQRAASILADSRLLVVPTDDEDEKSRLARLETYKTIGLSTVLFFTSFVPVVREVMFAVAGIQLLKEVYEGIASWTRGEQEQATDYLFDSLENLILMAAMAAGASAVGKGYKAVRSSDFVLGLRTVPVATGSWRLWKPDLAAYRQSLALPRPRHLDEQGLVSTHHGRYLALDENVYGLRPVEGSDLWEIQDPQPSQRYVPVLETNGAGAWRHDSELPQDWNLLTLFRRLGYREVDVPDARALQVLAVCGVEEEPLRRLYIDRSRPMAVLTDTLRRFQADVDASRFIQQIYTPAAAAYADADLQLFLVTSSQRWPQDTAITVTGIAGDKVALYGPGLASRQIKIKEDLLKKGQFHSPLLAGLTDKQRSHLLGSKATDQATQAALLVLRLAAETERKRPALFDRLVQRADVLQESNAAPIRNAFVSLPASVADELAAHADAGEAQELEAARVPLRLAEEARRYNQVLRLNRAYEGLYLDGPINPDSDRLVLDTLAHLPGWPDDVFIQIRQAAKGAEETISIGPNDAQHRAFISARLDGYEAMDAQDKLLFRQPKLTRAGFFQTLWESLSTQTRQSLGVDVADAGLELRQKITALALQRREAFARAIGVEVVRPGGRSPMGLADRLIQRLTLLTTAVPTALARVSPALRQRSRELYPSLSSAQIDRFLLTLGTDEVLAVRALERLRQEYQSIRNTLEQWVRRETRYQQGDGPRLKVPTRSKERATRAILRAWRKESGFTLKDSSMLFSLTLDAQPLGDLPVLIGDFSHIGMLEMNQIGSSAGLNAFLRNFPNLQTLSLNGNQLTRIPLALADMPRLIHLDLSDNQIQLLPESMAFIANKSYLQTLGLSFNPDLGRAPAVASLSRLKHLALRGTGLREWPAGTSELPDLQTLELRDNLITEIPSAVFQARAALNRGTNVDGNPLSASSLQAIATYQQSTGINLGVNTLDYQAGVRASVMQTSGSWIAGMPAGQTSQRQALWASLTAEPNSASFFRLLGNLRSSADFIRLQADMTRRVWAVLEAAGEDDRLRRELFLMARVGGVSDGEAARLFSDMEVRVLCFRAVAAARTGTQSLEGELIRLSRGLFRLDQLERFALIETRNRARTGAFTRGQAQELGLNYRVRLAQRLDLPAQPRNVDLQLDADVTAQQLEHAYQEVVRAETPAALLESITARDYWSEYLLTTYRDQFIAHIERSAEALAQLEAQVQLNRPTATQRMMAIMDNYKNERQQLLNRLTTQALLRHPGSPAPITPAS